MAFLNRSGLRSLAPRWKWRLLPVLAFGVPLVAIAFVQYRWLGEIQTRAQLIESQRNRETANLTVDLLAEDINRARLELLPAIVHADVLYLREKRLARVFDGAGFNFVDRYFVWSAPDPPEATLFYFPEDRSFRPMPDLASRFPADVWRIGPLSRRWAEFRGIGGGSPLQVVVHRIIEPEGARQRGFVGFTVDLSSFARNYLPTFHAEKMMPLLMQLGEPDQVPVAFLDELGECRFGVPRCIQPATASSRVEFPMSFGVPTEGAGRVPRWTLVVGDTPDGVQEALRHGALGNLAIVGAGILVLAMGALLIARSSRREAQLSDLKSRFISGISHELKTPLSLIRLYSEMLELGRVREEERKEFYLRLRQQSEALGDMLEQIMDFSRLEAEQQPRRTEVCSAEEILEEAVDMLTASGVVPRNVSLTVEEGLPLVSCDRRGLVRAVYNLLDNAAKYSHPDQPIIVHAAQRNGSLALEVVDRGAGIPGEEIPHIFERFYRGRLASTMAVKGTGLGLSIAETTVKAHQGKLEVASAPGEGSRFTILLPLVSLEARP
jgi:signal transduction histidine kinase